MIIGMVSRVTSGCVRITWDVTKEGDIVNERVESTMAGVTLLPPLREDEARKLRAETKEEAIRIART